VDKGRVFCGNIMLAVGYGLIQTGQITGGGVWTREGYSVVTEY
jgi:hypothetical protein